MEEVQQGNHHRNKQDEIHNGIQAAGGNEPDNGVNEAVNHGMTWTNTGIVAGGLLIGL